MLVLFPLVAACLIGGELPEAGARPEFARREGRACGYCHINPRGGGARNQRGLAYARNEFKFPPRKGDLTVFVRASDRKAMIAAQRLINLDHIKAAVAQLKKVSKTAKGDAGKKAARDELHNLDVRGTEILGQARRMLRGSEAEEAIELLCMLVTEYKGLGVYEQANVDLRELRSIKEYRATIVKEQGEAKARLLYLDGLRYREEKQTNRARKAFESIVKKYAGTRAAKDAKKHLSKSDAPN